MRLGAMAMGLLVALRGALIVLGTEFDCVARV